MSDCLPCDLETAESSAVIYRDDTWSCEIADGYDVPGWFILRLRRHAEGWAGPTAGELSGFGPVSQKLAAAIQSATGATGTYFMSFGENYPHFHFLVIARDADLPPDSRGAAILARRADGRDLAEALTVGARVRNLLTAPTP
jgi:diadenosine tetraphosphate (Ap4A) HIT family hydrolase